MKVNLSILGERAILVPYAKEFVPLYHQWMQDPYLLEMTGSEPLNLKEEYSNQQTWWNDQSKLTFIILDRTTKTPVGDVNLFFSTTWDEIGNRSHQDDNSNPLPLVVAEINVMIAESKFRKRGIAREAIQLISWYCEENIHGYDHKWISQSVRKVKEKESSHGLKLDTKCPIDQYRAHIMEGNIGSIRLFESMGFSLFKAIPVFGELLFGKNLNFDDHQPDEENDGMMKS